MDEIKEKAINVLKSLNKDTLKNIFNITDMFSSKNASQSLITPELLGDFEAFKDLFNESSLDAEILAENLGGVDDRIVNYVKTCEDGMLTTEGFAASLNQQTFSAKASQIALKGLSTAMNSIASAIVFSLISKGIAYITEQINNYIHRNEIAIEKAETLFRDFKSEINSITANQNKVKGYTDEFKKLSEGVDDLGRNVSLTNDEYSRYQNIVKELTNLNPSLIAGYDEENNILADKNSLMETSIQLLEDEYNQKLKNLALPDNVNTTIEGAVGRYDEAQKRFFDVKVPTTIVKDQNGNSVSYGEPFASNTIGSYIGDIIGVEFNGSWENDLNQYILNNADAIFNNLDKIKEHAKLDLDDNQLIDFMDYLYELRIAYNDLTYAATSANSTLQYTAMAEESYADLSDIQKKFITDYVNGIRITSNMTQEEKDNIRESIIRLTQELSELSEDSNVQDALSKFYTPQADDETVKEYRDQIGNALQIIQSYFTKKRIELPVDINTNAIDKVYSNYDRITRDAIKKFTGVDGDNIRSGYDARTYNETRSILDRFAKENSINTQDEIAFWNQCIEESETLEEAMEKYLQQSDGDFKDFNLSDHKDAINTYISEVNHLNSLLSSIENGDLSPEDKIELDLLGIQGEAETLSAGIEKLVNDKFQALKRTLGENCPDTVLDDLRAIANTSEDVAQSIENANNALNELLDTTQSDISKYYDYIGKLQSGSFTSTDMLDLFQLDGFKDAYKETGDLESALRSLVDNVLADTDAWLRENTEDGYLYADMLEQIRTDAEFAAKGISSTTDAISAMQNTKDIIQTVTDEISDTGEISVSTLKEIMSNYPSMIDAAQQYMRNSSIENQEAIINGLQQCYLTDYQNYCEYLMSKMKSDESFYMNDIIPNCEAAVSELVSQYDTDLKNYKTYTEAKQALDQAYYKSLSEAEASNYGYYTSMAGDYQNKIRELSIPSSSSNSSNDNNARIVDYQKQVDYYTRLANEAKNRQQEALNTAEAYKNASAILEDGYSFALENMQSTLNKNSINAVNLFKDANGNVAKELSSATKDWSSIRLEEVDKTIDRITTAIEHAEGSGAKNSLIDRLIGLDKTKISDLNNTISLYQQMADRYMKEIPDAYKALAKDGGISITEFIGDGNDEVRDAIENYREWAGKIDDLNSQLADTKQALLDLEVDKFRNIIEEYEQLIGIFENSSSVINGMISLVEARGEKVGVTFYEELIANAKEQLKLYQEERNALSQRMTEALRNGVKLGSDEWNEMYSSLTKIDSSIIQCQTDIENFGTSIQELHFENLDKIADKFNHLSDETDKLTKQLNVEVVTKGGQGGDWTEDAITYMGLMAQKYEVNKYLAEQYGKEIENLNKDYKRGVYSASEYYEKLHELQNSQWASIEAYQSAEDAIVSLNESRVNEAVEGINLEIDTYTELIRKQKDALSAEKSLREYQKSISSKQKDILAQQRKANALAASDDRLSRVELISVQEELNERLSDLNETQYNREMELRQEALDKELDSYTKAKEAEIEALKNTLTNENLLINASFETVKANASVVLNGINAIVAEKGIYISSEIIKPWNDGSNAITSYRDTLTQNSSSFMTTLQKIIDKESDLQTQADITASSLVSSMNVRTSVSAQTVENVREKLDIARSHASILGDTLSSVLSKKYDTSNVVNSISNIKDSINDARDAFNHFFTDFNEASSKGYYESAGTKAGHPMVAIYDNLGNFIRIAEEKWAIQNGFINRRLHHGVVTASKGTFIRKANNPLDYIAHTLGEDTMIAAKAGERVLTPAQNELWEKWTNALPNLVNMADIFHLPMSVRPDFAANSNVGGITIENVDASITVEGSIDKNFAKDFEALQNQLASNVTKKLAKSLKEGLGLQINAYDKSVR